MFIVEAFIVLWATRLQMSCLCACRKCLQMASKVDLTLNGKLLAKVNEQVEAMHMALADCPILCTLRKSDSMGSGSAERS